MNAKLSLTMTVLDRDGYRCVCCGKPAQGVRGVDWSLHHRQPRGMGGRRRKDTAADLLTVCGSGTTGCHGLIEVNRADARSKGWLVWQSVDPDSVAVLIDHLSRWVYLSPDGRYLDAPEEAS